MLDSRGLVRFFPVPILVMLSFQCANAEDTRSDQKPYSPKVMPASGEAQTAIRSIRLPAGMEISLFAAEPMLANPVCFCIDLHNRFYVAETFRIHAGVEDTREHMYWLDDDLACRSVADRVAMFRKHLGEKIRTYAVEHDRIRLIEDTDGDGKADRSAVFADGFNDVADGIGAGLLARSGKVWYTCIPHLWLLEDRARTGRAVSRQPLHSGFGVHVNFFGHDLHGLCFGPDGKIYFSIGDRGLNVATGSRRLFYPDMGVVLRCNPDGTELEAFATGLRNPQELAFDQFGNLFTGDNNSDGGDRARWVYVVEGGDSGWRIGYQYLEEPVQRGPWNAEKLWHTQWPGQAAYIVPPLAHIGNGPSGLAYYPGLGLPERYQNHFFLCDFRGMSGASGIRSLSMKPRGAAFEVIDEHQFIWSVLATDVDFGMDGGLYILDWVHGWSGTGKGRIHRAVDTQAADSPMVRSLGRLMAEGMAGRSHSDLATFLEHPDMRLRLEAQFALASRGAAAVPVLTAVARNNRKQLPRLHAIWGLGQIAPAHGQALAPVIELLTDADAEVRAQAAKVAGEQKAAQAGPRLIEMLRDSSPRVRYHAALSLGKLACTAAGRALRTMLLDNADRDVYLRHAGIMALAGIADRRFLAATAKDPSRSVRLAAVVALRRLEDSAVAAFLADSDPAVALEAARAIYDLPLDGAFEQLAATPLTAGVADPLGLRILNANFRLGGGVHAARVARAGADPNLPKPLRIEAIRALAQWARPSGRDRLLGLWRPLPERKPELVIHAIEPHRAELYAGPAELRVEAARLAAAIQDRQAVPHLRSMLRDTRGPADFRLEALQALHKLSGPGVSELADDVAVALVDNNAEVRVEGLRILAAIQPAIAVERIKSLLESGGAIERQGALAILGELKHAQADELLLEWLGRLEQNKVPLELQLDLLLAAGKRSTPAVSRKLAAFEKARSGRPPVDRFREALAGGNAKRGMQLFISKTELSCLRCHKIKDYGGDVGPDLAGIGGKQAREYLLNSIIDPNKDIAKGFETTVVATSRGLLHTGIVKAEDAKELRLITAEGNLIVIPASEIEERSRGKSAMSEDLVKHMTKSELRDLIEFLAGLK